MVWAIYTVSEKKNIPDIVDCHLKTSCPVLIIFGTNISDTTVHQMTNQFLTSPIVCFYITWGKLNERNMRQNEQKYAKKHSTHYRLWLYEW